MKTHEAPSALGKTRYEQSEAEKTVENFPILLSKKAAAKALSVCVRTIENLIAAKELPCRHLGRRVLISHAALLAFARRDHVVRCKPPTKPGQKAHAETFN